MKLDQEDKKKIKLICKIFNAQSVYIDGVKVNVPRPLNEGEGETNDSIKS